MKRRIAVCACTFFIGAALAQEADKPAEAPAAGTRLSKEELQSFIPGTEASYINRHGSVHAWTNELDGKFVASTVSPRYNMTGKRSTGHGSWRISDDGKYCIEIGWKRDPESWCSFVWRTADGYALGADAPDRPIQLKK